MRWIALMVVSILLLGCAPERCCSGKPCTAPQVQNRTAAASILLQTNNGTDQITSTLSAIEDAIGVVTYNISNAETTGFKRTIAKVAEHGALTMQMDLEQGRLENTGRALDVAVQGKGFFKVKLPDNVGDGHGYTRCGALNTNSSGYLVVAMGDGYQIEPSITIPPNAMNVCIGTDGVITYKNPGSPTLTKAGQLPLYLFPNPEGTSPFSSNLYQMTDTSGSPIKCNPGEDGAGQTLGGFLEASNVNRVKEQVRLNYLTTWRNDLMEIAKKMSPSILVPNISQK